MDYRFQAEDLWERILNHQDSLSEDQIVQMIEDTIYMAVQDYINEETFADAVPGKNTEELRLLLQKGIDYAEKCESYVEAAYFSAADLEHQTQEDRFIAAKLNLIDTGASARNTHEKLEFIKKQLKLE